MMSLIQQNNCGAMIYSLEKIMFAMITNGIHSCFSGKVMNTANNQLISNIKNFNILEAHFKLWVMETVASISR